MKKKPFPPNTRRSEIRSKKVSAGHENDDHDGVEQTTFYLDC
jgi:hypothetical protein